MSKKSLELGRCRMLVLFISPTQAPITSVCVCQSHVHDVRHATWPAWLALVIPDLMVIAVVCEEGDEHSNGLAHVTRVLQRPRVLQLALA